MNHKFDGTWFYNEDTGSVSTIKYKSSIQRMMCKIFSKMGRSVRLFDFMLAVADRVSDDIYFQPSPYSSFLDHSMPLFYSLPTTNCPANGSS